MSSCNCTICAREFDSSELGQELSKINVTRFKICQACLDMSDPDNDYLEARKIIDSYLKFSEAFSLFKEVKQILKNDLRKL